MNIYLLLTQLGLAFSALFTIVNPFSTASVFLTITQGESKKKKKYLSKKAALTAFIVLLIFSTAGNLILKFFGITIQALMIAGGLIVSSIGFSMLHNAREKLHSEDEQKEAIDKDDISIIPLAIPMLSGPGAITTSIVLMGDAQGPVEKSMVIIAVILVCTISYFILSKADLLEKHISLTGRRIIARLMGLIVLVIGVQFIINGVTSILRGILV